MPTCFARWSRVLACCLVALGGLAARAEDQELQPVRATLVSAALNPALQQPTYWIGVTVHPADDALRTKWKIASDAGLVVDRVAPGSPADQAGLRAENIILAVGDAPVASLVPLAQAVSQGQVLQLQTLCDGKPGLISVRPTKRPMEDRAPKAPERIEKEKPSPKEEEREKSKPDEKGEESKRREKDKDDDDDKDEKEHKGEKREEPGKNDDKNERHDKDGDDKGKKDEKDDDREKDGKDDDDDRPSQQRREHDDDAGSLPGLPEQMQVIISKQGKRPATITVKHGDKLWRTTEAELEMLPDEARGYLARVLGRKSDD